MDVANEHFIDLHVVDADGEKVGTVTDVIVDPENLEPQYLTVSTGLLDPLKGEHLLPIVVVERRGDELAVPFGRELVKTAPKTRDHTPPTSAQREQIAQHYGV